MCRGSQVPERGNRRSGEAIASGCTGQTGRLRRFHPADSGGILMTGKLSTPTVLKTIIDRKVEEVRERQGMASLSEVIFSPMGQPRHGAFPNH